MSPRAERLAALLAAWPRRRVRLAELWGLLDEADPASAGSVDRHRLLREALDELVAAGTVTRSVPDAPGRPGLPQFVVRAREAPTPAPRRPVIWHPELAWAADRRLTEAQSELLAAVNRWLFGPGPRGAALPLHERAWEVTGDEKAFDAGLVADGSLGLQVLRAYRAELPLHTADVGKGPVLLVVENGDTFDSLRRVLAAEPGAVGRVAWGAGRAFGSSVLALRSDPPGAIRYFGDLDDAGLAIPAAASALAVQEGLPPVEPAEGLYAALLAHGRPAAAPRRVPPAKARALVSWLDPAHRDRAEAILVAGDRLAQEAVSLGRLSGADWRAGLQWSPPLAGPRVEGAQ